MKKVKVTQEQANAIKATQNYNQEKDVLKFITQDLKTPNDIFHCLSDMDLNDLMSAFVNGYEVESQFKVGDWVIVTSSWNDNKEGRTIQIEELGKDCVYDKCGTFYYLIAIRHATKAEIKAEEERQLWLSLGRKVGEFVVGDVCIDDEGILSYVKEKSEWEDEHISIEEAKNWYEDGDFIGFYPVESLIKF